MQNRCRTRADFADFVRTGCTLLWKKSASCRQDYADFVKVKVCIVCENLACRLHAHFFSILQTWCRPKADQICADCRIIAYYMHTYSVFCRPSRPDAEKISMHCRIIADSMHTLRRANQCHSNAAARPRGPAGGGGRPQVSSCFVIALLWIRRL